MRTLVKALFFACWLLGAALGFAPEDENTAEDAAVYRFAVTDGLDVSVHGHRVVLRVDGGLVPYDLSLSVGAPRWMLALARRTEMRPAIERASLDARHEIDLDTDPPGRPAPSKIGDG